MRISDWSSDVCSSDLPGQARPDEPLRVAVGELDVAAHAPVRAELPLRAEAAVEVAVVLEQAVTVVAFVAGQRIAFQRSEEHTSELQSLMRISYALFCLKKQSTPGNPRLYASHLRSIHTQH